MKLLPARGISAAMMTIRDVQLGKFTVLVAGTHQKKLNRDNSKGGNICTAKMTTVKKCK
jgi:hypothetical protein